MSASWVFLFGLLLGVSAQVVHGNFFDGVKEGFSNFGDSAKEWGQGLGDTFRNFGKGALEKMNKWKDAAMEKFMDALPENVRQWIRGGDYSDANVEELVEKIPQKAWNVMKLEALTAQLDDAAIEKLLNSDKIPNRVKQEIKLLKDSNYSDANIDDLVEKIPTKARKVWKLEGECKLKLGGVDDEGNQKLWLFRLGENGGELVSTDARGDGRNFMKFSGTREEMARVIKKMASKGQDQIIVPGNNLTGEQPVMWKVEDGKIFRAVWQFVTFCNRSIPITDRTRQVQNGGTSTIGGKDVASPAETTPAPENRATKVAESSRPQDDEGSEVFSGKYPPAPREV